MPLIIRFWLTCIFLCVVFITNAQFDKANQLKTDGYYELAALEYERVVFKNNDPDTRNKALLQKSLCYKSLGNHSLALKTLERANLFIKQDSINFSIRYEWVLNAYLSDNYPSALSQLVQIEYFFKNNLYDKVLYLHILTLNELRRWEEAKEKYIEYENLNDIGLSADEAYSFLKKTKIKNPVKAENISYFLPGVGQMYAGYFGKGLVSSLIQASLITFGAYSLYEGYFFTGALTGVGLFWAFYSGGTRHAKYLAEKKNEELTQKYNEPIRKALLSTERNK